MARCMNCMTEYDDRYGACPDCNTLKGTKAYKNYHLPVETLLNDRYIIGLSVAESSINIKYNAYDKLRNKPVFVVEYYPSNLVERTNDTIIAFRSTSQSELFARSFSAYIDDVEKLSRLKDIPQAMKIKDYFIENSTCYTVYEYEDYTILSEYLRAKRSLTPTEAKNIMYNILHILMATEKTGLIHGNISPEHIAITGKKEVIMLDFGVASYVNSTRQKVYNPQYSPKEAFEENTLLDKKTDVYSSSAIFYRILSGVRPLTIEERQSGKGFISLRKLGIKIPVGMDNAILNGLNYDPKDRYTSIEDLYLAIKNRHEKLIKPAVKSTPIANNEYSGGRGKHTGLIVAIIILVVIILTAAAVAIPFTMRLSSDSENATTEISTENTTLTATETTTTEVEKVNVGTIIGRNLNEVKKELEEKGFTVETQVGNNNKSAKGIVEGTNGIKDNDDVRTDYTIRLYYSDGSKYKEIDDDEEPVSWKKPLEILRQNQNQQQ